MTTFNNRRLPNSAAMTDYAPATRDVIGDEVMGRGREIVDELTRTTEGVRDAMMGPRSGTDYLCETCQQTPDQPAQDGGHPYVPMQSRVPGVHPSADDGRVRNYNPAIDGPGQDQMDVGDDQINSGRAEQEFGAQNARHREGTWPRGDVAIDRVAIREGFGPNVIRMD